MHKLYLIILILPFLISGCASVKGYPDRLKKVEDELKDISLNLGRELVNKCKSEPSIQCRNNIISNEMKAMDINFSEFEQKLFKENRELSFLTTISSLGLSTAGAMTGVAVLPGIATGIIGSKEAYDKEILLEHAKIAIHTQMKALRQTVATRLRHGMKQPYDQYSLEEAEIDIEEYFNAGTLLGAFIGISASAGQIIQETEVNKNRINKNEDPIDFSPLSLISSKFAISPTNVISKDTFVSTETSHRIRKWLINDADKKKYNALKKWLIDKKDSATGLQVEPSAFITQKQYEKGREEAIVDLKIP